MMNIAKEKYLIMRNRPDMPTPVYWNFVGQTSLTTKKLYETRLSIVWYLYKNERGQAIYEKLDWDRVADFISSKLFKSKKYFNRLQKKASAETKKIERFFERLKQENIREYDFKKLFILASRIKTLWLDYDVIIVPAFSIGGDRFKEKIDKLLKLPCEEFLFLTTPLEKTGVSGLEYEFLHYIKSVKENKRELDETAEKLADKYGWIPFGYDGPEYWDKNYFINKLKNSLKNYTKKIDEKIRSIERTDRKNLANRERIISKHNFNKRELDLINRINVLAFWTDERKRLDYKLHYYYSQILLELEKRYDIPYKNLKHLFVEELPEIKKSREKALKISRQRIKGGFLMKFRNGRGKFVSGAERGRFMKDIKEQLSSIKKIKGTVASRGPRSIYRSRVKILLSPKDGDKVKNGDFLVATMTTPDYIISMRKAAGFITDEGGVTCHAAIVSREMNKPCIIGTKIATKVLKDGDLVEVDAEKGIIKKLK